MARHEAHILAVDHGTSGIKTSLVTARGEIVATESENLPTIYLDGGGAEQDPEGWWQALLATGRRLMDRRLVPRDAVKAVSVSSTFSTTVAAGKDGRHLMNAITWLDTRGAPYVRRFMGGFPSFQGYGVAKAVQWIRKTGGAPTLTGKDDLAHALLVRHEFPEIYRETHKFLPSKDYFNLRLTGRFEATYDSIQLFWLTDTRNIRRIDYDPALLEVFEFDRAKLPDLVAATDLLGPLLPHVADALGLPRATPVVAGSPDHQAAGIGSGAVADFDAHLYIGTSSWIQCNVPFKKTDPLHSIASLPMSIPGKYYCANEQDLAGGCLSFILENIVYHRNAFMTGAPTGATYETLDAIAGSVPAGSHNLLFLPWLNGERTPVDDPHVRGGLFNASKTTTSDHIVRAVMEGVAYNTRWSLTYVERFLGRRLPHIRMIGGGALSHTWCQIFADVLQREIRRVKDPRQANARGAAFLAAVGLGLVTFEEIPALTPVDRTFAPNPANRKVYDHLYGAFVEVYNRNKTLFRKLNAAP